MVDFYIRHGLTRIYSMNNFQRKDSKSNAHVGKDFEEKVCSYFSSKGIELEKDIKLNIGINSKRKKHAFDLGSFDLKIIIECKSHKWTEGNKVPSAKITVWNEAMFYFSLVPNEYKKKFVVLKDYSETRHKTLAEYYIERNEHLIPDNVEVWEFAEENFEIFKIYPK